MKLKVKQGSVKYNDTIYKEGQTFEIDDIQGKSLLNVGIVEEVKKKVLNEKSKKDKKEEVKKVKVKKSKVDDPVKEEVIVEPSLDWTRKELDEYANKLGIKDFEKLPSKTAVFKLIQAKKGVKV